jgi:hypothetical protein
MEGSKPLGGIYTIGQFDPVDLQQVKRLALEEILPDFPGHSELESGSRALRLFSAVEELFVAGSNLDFQPEDERRWNGLPVGCEARKDPERKRGVWGRVEYDEADALSKPYMSQVEFGLPCGGFDASSLKLYEIRQGEIRRDSSRTGPRKLSMGRRRTETVSWSAEILQAGRYPP